MQDDKRNAHQANQVVFSVCATSDVVTAGTDAAASTPGSLFVGEFQEYIAANRRPKFSPILKEAPGCVALIDCDSDPELALETMTRLQEVFLSRLSIVAVSSQMDSGLLLRAMRSGCNEFLTKPVDAKELSASLIRFQNKHIVDSTMHQNRGRVISFFGAKGGVGATTLAVHLAIHLVRHQHKTLLIDHKHQLGHVALYLGLTESHYHFGDLIRNVDRLDTDLLNGFVTRHTSGLEVLASPDLCAPTHMGTHEDIEHILDFLQRQYDYILIDSSVEYKESLSALLHWSYEVCVVSTPDVAALRDLARHIEHLSLSDDVTGKVRVIINRSTSNDAVTAEQIENLVRFPVAIAIPNNYADLVRAINAGEPISPSNRSAFSQQIAKWSAKLAPENMKSEKLVGAKKLFALWR